MFSAWSVRAVRGTWAAFLSLVLMVPLLHAQGEGASLRIYGFAQADFIADFKQNNPDWFDVNRPTQLPSFKDQYGKDGHFWASVRQSRFGVEGLLPAGGSDVKAVLEIDLFGVGADAGQTTIRLRQAYGQWKQFGAGLLPSNFMNADIFPNVFDYWGPNGMIMFRNVQLFYEPIQGESRLRFSLERPGASGDEGIYADRIEVQNLQGRFPLPDFSAKYRLGRSWGHVEAAGIVRYIVLDDLLDDAFDLNQHVVGWGVALSTNVKTTDKDVLRAQVVYGAGVENYFNDAPQDVGGETDLSDPVHPLKARALADLGLTLFYDHYWNDKWSTTLGYSRIDIDNTNAQRADAFRSGQYAILNLVHYPAPNVIAGAEFQYAHRKNFSDGFQSDDFRLQFSFKYVYGMKFGGTKA